MVSPTWWGDHHTNLECFSPCRKNIHLQAFKTQEGKKKEKYSTRHRCQKLTPGAGLGTWLVGGMHVCTDNDARRQEAATAAGCCVGKEGEETPFSPFFCFSAFLTNSPVRQSQISMRKKLLADVGRKLLTFASCWQPLAYFQVTHSGVGLGVKYLPSAVKARCVSIHFCSDPHYSTVWETPDWGEKTKTHVLCSCYDWLQSQDAFQKQHLELLSGLD